MYLVSLDPASSYPSWGQKTTCSVRLKAMNAYLIKVFFINRAPPKWSPFDSKVFPLLRAFPNWRTSDARMCTYIHLLTERPNRVEFVSVENPIVNCQRLMGIISNTREKEAKKPYFTEPITALVWCWFIRGNPPLPSAVARSSFFLRPRQLEVAGRKKSLSGCGTN